MSQSFSLVSWLIRIHRSDSCIDHDSKWYALAEDWKGSHCPYPQLPMFAQCLFDWRVAVARRQHQKWQQFGKRINGKWWIGSGTSHTWIAKFLNRIFLRWFCRRIRGGNWWFRCGNCGDRSFYTLKNEMCRGCGFYWLVRDGKPPRCSALKFAHWLEDLPERFRHWRRISGSDVPF